MRYPLQHRRFLALLGLGLLAGGPLAAQTPILTNSGGTLFVNTGGVLTVNGGLAQTGAALLRTAGTATVTGNVASAAPATLDLSSGTLDVAGSVAHAGPTAGTTGTLRLSGAAAQTLALAGGTVPNLTVAKPSGAATLTGPVQVAQALTLANAGNLALNGQALTLLSDASGTALVVNSGTGVVTGSTATMQRYLATTNLGLGYRHYSSPVNGNDLSDLATASFTPAFNSAYNSSPTPGTVSPFPTVFGYDQARVGAVGSSYAPFDQGFFSPPAGAAAAFVPGVGYTVNLSGTEKVDFSGTLNTGSYASTLARSSNAEAGWGLVGNPYPAPLDYSLVTAPDRAGLDAAMYVYESTGPYIGQYRSYTNGIGNALIGSSQGFFVRVSSGQTTGTLTFRNAQRVSTFATQVAVRRGTADARPQLTLALAGSGLADALTVYAEGGATAGFDRQYDAEKLPNPTGLNLSSASATGQALAIDGRADFAAATVVPMSVGVPAAGSYTLTAASLANLSGTRAELVDNLTGTRTLLVAGASYAFTTTTTTAPGRFWLNLSPAAAPLATLAAALAAQVLAYPTPAHERLTVVRPAGAAASAVLLNTLGQTVRTIALPTAETTVDVSGLATGVYTLRLRLEGQTVVRRVVLN